MDAFNVLKSQWDAWVLQLPPLWVVAVELLICGAVIAVGAFVAKVVRRRLSLALGQLSESSHLRVVWIRLHALAFVFCAWGLMTCVALFAAAWSFPYVIFELVEHLLLAWLIVSLLASLLGSGFLVRFFTYLVWGIIVLDIVGALDPLIELLDDVRFQVGAANLSLYSFFKGLIVIALLLWGTAWVVKLIVTQIQRAQGVSPSLKVLFSKLTRICLFSIAVLVGLRIVGIDLTIFAVFGGALGVGLGFGLQKVVANFISGIILLSDRSVKPGDVIRVGDTYGWVNALGARYVSVVTRDGKEHLIPNETLITEKVENWSFTDSRVRIRIPIGISYNADVEEAMRIAEEVAYGVPRVLNSPAPRCLMRKFGDSSIDLELRIWIEDAANGMGNIQSVVLLALWKAFKEHNIEIPYPQRDVHIRSGSLVKTD